MKAYQNVMKTNENKIVIHREAPSADAPTGTFPHTNCREGLLGAILPRPT